MAIGNGKRMSVAAALVCGLMLAAIPAMAQQDAAPPPAQGDAQGLPAGRMGGRGGMMDPARRSEMMQRRLGLSADQTAAVKQILTDDQTKMRSQMASGQPMAPGDRRASMMATNEKIKALLTPEQKTKYDEMEAQQRARMQERREDGPPPAAPPQ